MRAPPFIDRNHAGTALATRLAALTPAAGVIAAIPRGGMIVATPIAALLGVPLTAVHTRKLTTPPEPELAFGALDEDAHAVVDYPLIAALRLDAADVDAIKQRVVSEIQRRQALYEAPPLSAFLPAERVVLVDDGMASGLTMDAAVVYARRRGAEEVVVAVPCASSQAAARLRGSADMLVALVIDPDFASIARYYADFPPVTDAEVVHVVSRLGGQPLRQRAR